MRYLIMQLLLLLLVLIWTGGGCLGADAAEADEPERGSLFRVAVDQKWGFIDRTGKVVIEPQFDWAYDFSEGLAQVRRGRQCGYIDRTGKWLFDAAKTYHERSFRCGRAVIDTDKGRAIMDRTGRVIECPFDRIEEFSEGLAAVKVLPKEKPQPDWLGLTGEKWGFINTEGELVIPAKFTAVGQFSHGLAPVYVGGDCDVCTGPRGGRWGYINQEGRLVIEPQFRRAESFSEGLATVSFDGSTYGWIDPEGKPVIKMMRLTSARAFHEGVARIRGASESSPGWNDFGYITKSGEVFVHPAFSASSAPFSEGLTEAHAPPVWDVERAAWIPGKIGYVDKRGNWVIDPQFTHTKPFRDGLALVSKDGKMAYIDKTGRFVWPPDAR